MPHIKKRVALLLLCCLVPLSALADTPFDDYAYVSGNENGLILQGQSQANAHIAPAAFSYQRVLDGSTLGLEVGFSSPEDMDSDTKGRLYILDTLNSRIVVVDSTLTEVLCIVGAWQDTDGSLRGFSTGKGLFVRGETVYVCLGSQGTIVAFDVPGDAMTGDHTPITVTPSRIIRNLDASAVRDDFHFLPVKAVVDRAGRLYAVIEGEFDGLAAIDSDGMFTGFIGADPISISAIDLFWRSVSTDAQIEAQKDTVPIEFFSLDVDENGFIYTTAKGQAEENLVRRLNLIGKDVLKSDRYYVKGELSPLTTKGTPGTPSGLIDISVTTGGVYTCLDNVRGKLYTYNAEGDVLFVFGGLSAQKGAFRVPTAVEWHGENLLVLDKRNNEVVVFEPTPYGSAVLKATRAQYSGGWGEAWPLWEEVIRLNPWNETALLNAGKLYFEQGDWQKAMEYFRLGNSKTLYSKAFEKHRNAVLKDLLPWILLGVGSLGVLALLFAGIRQLKRSKARYVFFRQEAARYHARQGRKGRDAS